MIFFSAYMRLWDCDDNIKISFFIIRKKNSSSDTILKPATTSVHALLLRVKLYFSTIFFHASEKEDISDF